MSDQPSLEWTKDELLAEAQARGIEVKDYWTKDQILEALQGGGTEPAATEAGVGVEPQVTTTSTKDYLGVALVNATPGTSQATDRLGRSVVSGNKDYMGRALVP